MGGASGGGGGGGAPGSQDATGADGGKASGKGAAPGKYRRSKAERRKALLRDAEDPKSGLTQEQRDFIRKTDGNKVPPGCEVSHERPLYTAPTVDGKRELDVAENMKTMDKALHRARHMVCGDQYHLFPP